jgi:hypothetical protein
MIDAANPGDMVGQVQQHGFMRQYDRCYAVNPVDRVVKRQQKRL